MSPEMCRFSDAGRSQTCGGLRRPAYENLQGRKPRWGNVGSAARYGGLSATRRFEARRFTTAVSLESVHNLDGTARILLNGESNFLAVCDFKQLHVAKRAHWTTSSYDRHDPLSHIGHTDASRPRLCLSKLFRTARQDDRRVSDCKRSSFESRRCGCSLAGIDAILPVVWSRSWSARRTDRLVRDGMLLC